LDTIPFYLLKRIGELKGCQLVEPDSVDGSEFLSEMTNHFTDAQKLMLLFSYFNPRIPSFSLDLVKRGIELNLIFSRNLFEKLSMDFQSKGEMILAQEKASTFMRFENTLETPAVIAVSENKFLLGLFNKKGGFEGQYLLSSEPEVLIWGKELFKYYIKGSEKLLLQNTNITIE